MRNPRLYCCWVLVGSYDTGGSCGDGATGKGAYHKHSVLATLLYVEEGQQLGLNLRPVVEGSALLDTGTPRFVPGNEVRDHGDANVKGVGRNAVHSHQRPP